MPELQKLAYEQIGIEFIPAVIKGGTRVQARRRIRSIFAHVNLTAVKLNKGQLILLNEDDGFAIVARKTAMNHRILKEKSEGKLRIDWDSATVVIKSTILTTLQALQEMYERYLRPCYPHWKSSDKGLIPMRPEEEGLETGVEEFMILWDYLANLSSYSRLENGIETPELRKFSFERKPGEGHVLFHPVGQVALAEALGILRDQKSFSLESVFSEIKYVRHGWWFEWNGIL